MLEANQCFIKRARDLCILVAERSEVKEMHTKHIHDSCCCYILNTEKQGYGSRHISVRTRVSTKTKPQ